MPIFEAPETRKLYFQVLEWTGHFCWRLTEDVQ